MQVYVDLRLRPVQSIKELQAVYDKPPYSQLFGALVFPDITPTATVVPEGPLQFQVLMPTSCPWPSPAPLLLETMSVVTWCIDRIRPHWLRTCILICSTQFQILAQLHSASSPHRIPNRSTSLVVTLVAFFSSCSDELCLYTSVLNETVFNFFDP